MTDKTELPTDEEIVAFISESQFPVSKQNLAQHFKISGKEPRQEFKKIINRLIANGQITKEKGRNYSAQGAVPEVMKVRVIEFNEDRFCFVCEAYDQENLKNRSIFIREKDAPKARANDYFIVRLHEKDNKLWAKPLRRIFPEMEQMVGTVALKANGAHLTPTNRRIKDSFFIAMDLIQGFKGKKIENGDLVLIKPEDGKATEIIDNLGPATDVKNVSLIAIHEQGIRTVFPTDAIRDAENAEIPPLKGRDDLRDLPFVTIDGEDARDFDDAVYAYEDEKTNLWHIWVAIADVAYYVRPQSPLDKEARKRGNSSYFPDRVVPMLPEALSNGLCSLNPNEDRGCMALHMVVDKHGALLKKKIHRGLMKSKARLTYTQVQNFIDGNDDELTSKFKKELQSLHKIYKILRGARDKRGALDIHGTEQKVIFNDHMKIIGLGVKPQLMANEVIEELMVLSNVAVAELLEEKNAPCIYRVHENPPADRLDNLKSFLSGFGYKVPTGENVSPLQINAVLQKSFGTVEQFVVNESVLRSQSQAYYTSDNQGHFGLSLDRYAHFTSPIRRYADLIVHRSLIKAYKLGDDGITDKEINTLENIAEDISDTERNSVRAERDTMSRFTAIYLSEQEEQAFDAQISGVNDFGLFVRLPQYGAEGLIPIRTLPDDYYAYDEKSQSLRGRRTGRIYQLLATLKVRVVDIDPVTNSIVFATADDKGAQLENFKFSFPEKGGKSGGRGGAPSRFNKSRGRGSSSKSDDRRQKSDKKSSRSGGNKRKNKKRT